MLENLLQRHRSLVKRNKDKVIIRHNHALMDTDRKF